MLKIEHLTKKYGDKAAVQDLSLHISKGDIYGFIGHNGAGKTTTIKAIVGIHNYEEGTILVDGISVKEHPLECKNMIAYIPDNPDIFEYLTGIQYLNFTADIYGVSKTEREQKIRKYADLFEITGALGDLVSSYSHGMKQKLAIVSALIHSPKLIIMDEPFVGLDPKAALVLKRVMHEMCQEGCAFFFSTHVLDVAEKLCNKIAIIKDGKLISSGNMQDLVNGQTLEDVFMEVVEDGKTD